MLFRDAKQIALDTFGAYSADHGERLAAALAYYATFSLAPLIVLALAIAGLLYGQRSAVAQEELIERATGIWGPEGAALLKGVLEGASTTPSAGIWATILSVFLLVIGATALFARLQEALNTIWDATPQYTGLIGFLRSRALSLLLVVGAGTMIVASLLASSLIASLVDLTGSRILIWIVERLGSLVVLTLLFAVLYRTLPDAPVRWSEVWTGAFMAAILITLGTWAFGWYLGRASVTSSYGAAGALAGFLLWIYYSAQIFFLGAELTTVQAHRTRPHESPEPTASPRPTSKREPGQETLKSGKRHAPTWIARLGWIGLGVVLARLFGK